MLFVVVDSGVSEMPVKLKHLCTMYDAFVKELPNLAGEFE